MAEETSPLKVALLGAGVVGSQVARILSQEADSLRQRIGRPLELVGIGVRRLDVQRPGIDPDLFTMDVHSLVTRGDLDLVIEVIGGIEPARTLLTEAMNAGASVVTANKALLAEDLAQLSATAKKNGVDLYYEAAVAGAIPIIRPLRESLVGDEIRAVMGIVNGTTNYILDQMTTNHLSFEVALRQAQELGFAEADPTADIEGKDAAAKAAILAGLAFHTEVHSSEVFCEGITSVTETDIRAADRMGCVVKLLAVAKLADDDRVIVKVHPTMIPKTHPLASVSGAYNAIFVESVEAGQLMFLGQGPHSLRSHGRRGNRGPQPGSGNRWSPRDRIHQARGRPDRGCDQPLLHSFPGGGQTRCAGQVRHYFRSPPGIPTNLSAVLPGRLGTHRRVHRGVELHDTRCT